MSIAGGIGTSGVPHENPTLADYGISKKVSSVAQQLAALPMGFVSRVTVDAADETLELDAGTVSPIPPDSRGVIRWQWIGDDWIDYGTGELLSGFTPSDTIRELVKRITADARSPDHRGRDP